MFNRTETADEIIPIMLGPPTHKKDLSKIAPLEMDLYKNITQELDEEELTPILSAKPPPIPPPQPQIPVSSIKP